MRKKILPFILALALAIQFSFFAGMVSAEEAKVILIPENSSYVFTVESDEDAQLNAMLTYKPVLSTGALEYSVKINGEQRAEWSNLSLNRSYVQSEGVFYNGKDQLMPQSAEQELWQTVYIYDSKGYSKDPMKFPLKSGQNTVEIISEQGDFYVQNITFENKQQPLTYEVYRKQHENKPSAPDYSKRVEAEKVSLKSHTELVPKIDRTSAAVSPNPKGRKIYNTIVSGSSAGQWLEYEIDVPADGFYVLDLKYKNNNSGQLAYKNIFVNGQILFDQLSSIKLPSANDYQIYTTPEIYFEKGSYTVRLETTLGDLGAIVQAADDILSQLTRAYRDATMYIGVRPDVYRDYDIEENLPEVIEVFQTQAEQLTVVADDIVSLFGNRNNTTSFMERFAFELEQICDDPEDLPKKMEQFRSNLSALASLSNSLTKTPVILDYLTLRTPNVEPDKPNAGFFSDLLNELYVFWYSFLADYNALSEANGNPELSVWITTGRDQAEVAKTLIRTDFIPNYNINVDLKLIQANTLTSSIVAGINPDAVIQATSADPTNFAFRNAVLPLNDLPDYDEVIKRFSESSLVPLTFQGKMYGLPETETFLMMFYRKDLLEELEISVPQTWDDAVEALTEIQKNNLTFGLPQGVGANTFIFGSLLYQQGGSFYENDTYLCALSEEKAVNSFTFLTDLFVNYKLDITYDFVTRFRVGEMPIAIGDISLYNNLQVAAPEIRGLWDIAPIPGTLKENGELDRSTINTGLACMILQNSDLHEQAWEFLKWWTSDQTQINYGDTIEQNLGPAGRYLSANLDAFESSQWSNQQIKTINEQRKWVKGVEAVPGGYFISRHIDNAFRKVVLSDNDARDTLREYGKTIDTEIEAKCEELKIPLERNK